MNARVCARAGVHWGSMLGRAQGSSSGCSQGREGQDGSGLGCRVGSLGGVPKEG